MSVRRHQANRRTAARSRGVNCAHLFDREPVDARGVTVAEGAREIALVGEAQTPGKGAGLSLWLDRATVVGCRQGHRGLARDRKTTESGTIARAECTRLADRR